jgi:hypothetical protein
MRVVLLVIPLVVALGLHSALDKRRKVEIVRVERVYVEWEAEGRELFAAPCL